jgi:cytoplasmic iron level regulating protein YaaA (DUF328/UPF0246 family)
MKIILSPSKTQKPHRMTHYSEKELLFESKHKKILAALRKLSKSDLQRIMKLSDDLLNQTYTNIKNYNSLESFQAFDAFTGLVFLNMSRDRYQPEEYKYIEKHLRILDAFYGILEPGTLIKPYRLDMKMDIGLPLYKHWDITDYFKDEIIINLASTEFSKMIQSDTMVTISFLQNKEGKYVNQATYSKMARGKFVNFMVENKVTTIEELFSFNQEGYIYNPKLSDNKTVVFTR